MKPNTRLQNVLDPAEFFEEKVDKIRARKCGFSMLYFTTRDALRAAPKRQLFI